MSSLLAIYCAFLPHQPSMFLPEDTRQLSFPRAHLLERPIQVLVLSIEKWPVSFACVHFMTLWTAELQLQITAG